MGSIENFDDIVATITSWADKEGSRILESGDILDDCYLISGVNIGVVSTENIRVLQVDEIPLPEGRDAKEALLTSELISGGGATLALGFAIFERKDNEDKEAMCRSLAHVAQFERMGEDLGAFLRAYLTETLLGEVEASPLAREAGEAEGYAE